MEQLRIDKRIVISIKEWFVFALIDHNQHFTDKLAYWENSAYLIANPPDENYLPCIVLFIIDTFFRMCYHCARTFTKICGYC